MSNLKTVLKSSALALVVGLAFAAPASADGGYGNGGGYSNGGSGGGHSGGQNGNGSGQYGQQDDDNDNDAAVTDDQAYFYGEGYARSRDYDGPSYGDGDRRGGGRHDRDGRGGHDGRDGRGGHDRGGYHDGRGGDRYSDNWERGWRAWDGFYQHGQNDLLNKRRLERRIERQGFDHVRDLRPSRYGFGWRAFARDRFGDAVVLRVDPYTGRVLGARYV